jgi:hypothetical protein
MSRTVIVILISHRHKPIDVVYRIYSLELHEGCTCVNIFDL